jgi:hypothetical protein
VFSATGLAREDEPPAQFSSRPKAFNRLFGFRVPPPGSGKTEHQQRIPEIGLSWPVLLGHERTELVTSPERSLVFRVVPKLRNAGFNIPPAAWMDAYRDAAIVHTSIINRSR